MKSTFLIAAVAITTLSASIARADVSVDTQDLNSDGVVTLQEVIDSHGSGIARTPAFMERHRKIFEGADANSDGVVDRSESQGGSNGKSKTKGSHKS
ncbi:MAG: hypothetical protein ACKVH0_18535 [Alphaproteobacteria bacterium]